MRVLPLAFVLCVLALLGCIDDAVEPAPDGGHVLASGPLTFTIDAAAARKPISDAIYGINAYPEADYLSNNAIGWGLFRWGGNSYSAWNWETNDSNAGQDLSDHPNYNSFMPLGRPDANTAGAVLDGVVSVGKAKERGAVSLVTVSLQGAVAADHAGGVPVASYAPSARFFPNHAAKGAPLCTCKAGDTACTGCAIDTADGNVYQDELVAYLRALYPDGGIYFSLDNEPDAWNGTHLEVWNALDADKTTYEGITNRAKQFAAGIKAAWPQALVFGPVTASLDGLVSAGGDYQSAHKPTEFVDYYLAQMAAAEAASGVRLLDVLDFHYYNGGSDPADCVQRPRDFWDPAYRTPDTTFDYIPGYKPRKLIPRMLAKIQKSYPGTKLAITEYTGGCEKEPAGAVAQADILGIFGREGLFAATAWPLASSPDDSWLVPAFAAYRDYDGKGARVGDTSVSATTTDTAGTSVYAFAHAADASRIEIVAINKASVEVPAHITIANGPTSGTAALFALTPTQRGVVAAGSVAFSGAVLDVVLPGASVTTIVLGP
jgi:hypothetical protein